MRVLGATIDVVGALLDSDPAMVVLVPHGHPAARLRARVPERVVAAPPGVRGAMAAGLCSAGRPVVSFWSGGEVPPVLGEHHVLVTGDAADATAVWARGVPVVHPCWSTDVGRLVRTATVIGEPVVVHAPDEQLPVPGSDLPALDGGRLRWLRPATASGAVLAIGLPAARSVAAATVLAREGLDLGVVEVPWQAGDRGRTPAHAARAVLLLPADDARALKEGRAAPEDVHGRSVPVGRAADLVTSLRLAASG